MFFTNKHNNTLKLFTSFNRILIVSAPVPYLDCGYWLKAPFALLYNFSGSPARQAGMTPWRKGRKRKIKIEMSKWTMHQLTPTQKIILWSFDAIGVERSQKTDSRPLEKKPGMSLKGVLEGSLQQAETHRQNILRKAPAGRLVWRKANKAPLLWRGLGWGHPLLWYSIIYILHLLCYNLLLFLDWLCYKSLICPL